MDIRLTLHATNSYNKRDTFCLNLTVTEYYVVAYVLSSLRKRCPLTVLSLASLQYLSELPYARFAQVRPLGKRQTANHLGQTSFDKLADL